MQHFLFVIPKLYEILSLLKTILTVGIEHFIHILSVHKFQSLFY